LHVDLDGDLNEETVSFWFSAFSFKLTVTRFDKTFHLDLPDLDHTTPVKAIHVAIKDVRNDGLPEILLGIWDGRLDFALRIYGSRKPGGVRALSRESFGLIQELAAQRSASVHEGGTIVMPYGFQDHALRYEWNGKRFENKEASKVSKALAKVSQAPKRTGEGSVPK
jgi:hypothetical protein